MKITPLAAAGIIPAAAAGLIVSVATLAAASAAPAAAAAAAPAPAAPAITLPRPAAAAVPAAGHQPAVPAPLAEPARAAVAPASAAEASFRTCVAWRESSDNPAASPAGLYGILPVTWAQLGYPGTAGQASVAVQTAAFHKLYQERGTQPWAAYDGC